MRLVAIGAALLALGMFGIPLSRHLALLVPAIAAAAIGFSLLTPSLISLVSKQATAGVQGGVMGVARSATTLARVLGPSFAGLVFQYFGRQAPFLAGATIMVGVVLIASATTPRPLPAEGN